VRKFQKIGEKKKLGKKISHFSCSLSRKQPAMTTEVELASAKRPREDEKDNDAAARPVEAADAAPQPAAKAAR
jgi:hypothetical protein